MPISKAAKKPKRSKESATSIGAAVRDVQPRAPSRSRGVQRYAALVDATEALLLEHSPQNVGLYQIAEQAGIAPASVYHFFPTKEAAFLALARKYLAGFSQLMRQPIDPTALKSWQTLFAWDIRRAMRYYNAHPPALKLFFGGFGGEETRQADRAYNERAARAMFARLSAAFHMPIVRDAEKRCHICLQILDAVWQVSYLKHGKITEEYFEEALNACTAYCRLFIPEQLEQREHIRAAVAAGKKLVIADEESVPSA